MCEARLLNQVKTGVNVKAHCDGPEKGMIKLVSPEFFHTEN